MQHDVAVQFGGLMDVPVVTTPLLRVEHLSKSYGLPGRRSFKALNAVSFDLLAR